MPRLSQIPILGPIARDVSILTRAVTARIYPPPSPREDFPRAKADAQVWAWLATSTIGDPHTPPPQDEDGSDYPYLSVPATSSGREQTTARLRRQDTTRSSRHSHHGDRPKMTDRAHSSTTRHVTMTTTITTSRDISHRDRSRDVDLVVRRRTTSPAVFSSSRPRTATTAAHPRRQPRA